MSESTPHTEQPHHLHRPSEAVKSDADENHRDDKPAITVTREQQDQTTTPSRHGHQDVHNDGNAIDDDIDSIADVDSHGNGAHSDGDNEIMSPALAQPQIQATRKSAAAASAAKPTKTKPWKIKHILIESSLTALCAFFLIIALVICTIFSWKQTTSRTSTTSSNHYCDKSNLISSSSECEMDFNSSTTSIISQSTIMHV